MDITGIVLAAHASAAGHAPEGTPQLVTAVHSLMEAGCREVIVVLGDGADAVAGLVPRGALPVVATDWEMGKSAVLKVGLAAAATSSADAVLITSANLSHHNPAAARRVMEVAEPDSRGTLARAHYDNEPGHPVLIGRDHWGEFADSTHGDMGDDGYLSSHLTVAVDCSDLGEPSAKT